jgi:hypothetical protein
MTLASRPLPVRIIEILGYLGVLFWIVTIIRAFIDDGSRAWSVLLVGLVLGGAHLVISVGSARRSRIVYAAMWLVLIGDTLLTLFVDVQAIALVLFTIVLLALTRPAAARAWFAA